MDDGMLPARKRTSPSPSAESCFISSSTFFSGISGPCPLISVPYAKQLQKKGAQNVLVSMAGEGAVLVAASGEVFEAPAPKGKLINGVGAGDSMVAGFMAGYMEKEDYLHAFHMGIAAGSASAFSENLATREEIASVYEQITK